MSSVERIETLLRRGNALVIPKDQQRLLETEVAWAPKLRNAPEDLLNVPDHVIKSVKQAYVQAKKLSRHGGPNSNGTKRPSSSDLPPPKRHTCSELPVPTTVEQDSSPIASPKSQVCDKSPSPRRDHATRSPALVPLPDRRESPRQSSRMPPPPVPALRQDVYAIPSDSSDEEDDLEVEVPLAGERQAARVNMAASHRLLAATPYQDVTADVLDTPPCAQPSHSIVPETLLKNAGPQPEVVRHEDRQHRHKMYTLNSSPIKPLTTAARSRRMATTKTFAGGADVSSSYSTSSSSVVPGTLASSTMNSVLASVEQGDTIMGVNEPQESDDSDSDDAAPSVHAQDVPVAASVPSLPDESPPAPQNMNPFGKFATTYPDYVGLYRGGLWSFIRALICLEYLKSERLIKESGYDEFIRAFSHGYLDYVSRAGPGQEPLPAVEWFNMLPGRQLYNDMVVRADNLNAIIRSFPHEVSRARRIVRGASEEAPLVRNLPSPQRGLRGLSSQRESRSFSSKAPEPQPDPEPGVISSGEATDVDPPETRPGRRRQQLEERPSGPASSEQSVRTSSRVQAAGSRPVPEPATPATATASSTQGRAPRSSGYFARLNARVSKSRQQALEEHNSRVQKHLRREGSSRRSSMSGSGQTESLDKSGS
ncbi:hypothetical protein JDV02_009060 [Purpureocillium takamizusanense]|uniref:Uncharacterized protein n=1 Tax=Purpureocillium takamizusanense TaxID=2060973 RepID=A0A9Q8QRM5_9HYPO|nr:uncharacterized protein JDV02_009060 [Purpureocillium takamizusanense]UNI23227.1 hypothetical protein JDV02_009060 [Purpureocillium takamizusanense]